MAECARPDECRITPSAVMTNCMYYPPVYDGHGNNLNPDRNASYYSEYCATCGRCWDVSKCAGEITRIERK